MAYVLQTISRKQEGTDWWGKQNPEAYKRIVEFTKGLNLVQRRVRKLIDPNTLVTRLFFADEAACFSYQTAVSNNPDYQARATWERESGITLTQKSAAI